jgi:hypothetical protein
MTATDAETESGAGHLRRLPCPGAHAALGIHVNADQQRGGAGPLPCRARSFRSTCHGRVSARRGEVRQVTWIWFSSDRISGDGSTPSSCAAIVS